MGAVNELADDLLEGADEIGAYLNWIRELDEAAFKAALTKAEARDRA